MDQSSQKVSKWNQLSLNWLFTFASVSPLCIIILEFIHVRVNSSEKCYEKISVETYLYHQRFDGLEKSFSLHFMCVCVLRFFVQLSPCSNVEEFLLYLYQESTRHAPFFNVLCWVKTSLHSMQFRVTFECCAT